jgi:hypothetical protein
MLPESEVSTRNPLGYFSKSHFASSMSSHPRSTGSIPVNSVDHVVENVSEGPARGGCRGIFCPAGGVIPLNDVFKRSRSGEFVFAAVLASMSNGCPKFDPNPVVVSVEFMGTMLDLPGLYSPMLFLIEAKVFSNSSIRLTFQH